MIYESADLDALDRYARESDLVLVASGKGEIGKLLERDNEKSVFDKPQRGLGIAYVKGLTPIKTRKHDEIKRGLTWNALPGIGEYFVLNALTTSGECDVMVFEAIPGGPADTLDMNVGPDQFLKDCVDVLDKFYPDEAARCKSIELTDDLGILTGRFPPTVRKPVMQLPGGGQPWVSRMRLY